MLCTLNISKEIIRFLANVFDKKALLQKLLIEILNQYCVRKIDRHNYNKAFEKVKENLLKYVKTMLKKNKNTNAK